MELNRSNYFSPEANRHYMSVSQFKDFCPAFGGCEERAVMRMIGDYYEEPSEALLTGSYMHAWNSNELDEFKEKNPQIFSSRGATAGQLKSNFQHCNMMISVLESDPLCMKALAGRKEVIFTANLYGADFKICIDSYQPEVGIFGDLKTMQDLHGKHWNDSLQLYENWIDHYGYGLQMAVYAEVERLATGREQPLIPHIIAVSKQTPPDHEIIYFDYDTITANLLIIERHIDRVVAVKTGKEKPERCNKCAYCRGSKKITRIKHVSELNLY